MRVPNEEDRLFAFVILLLNHWVISNQLHRKRNMSLVQSATKRIIKSDIQTVFTKRSKRTGHPLRTILSLRKTYVLTFVALCSTLIILVQIVSYTDKGSFYMRTDSLQSLFQQGDILTTVGEQDTTPKKVASSGLANSPALLQPTDSHKYIMNAEGHKSYLQDVTSITQAMLRMYKVIPESEVKRIVIVSYFRAGSTFLGDILQTPFKTFYHFEPYHITGATRLRYGDVSENEIASLFRHLLRCEFEELPEYLAWASRRRNQFLMQHNLFLWKHCTLKSNICFNGTYVQAMCHRSPLHLVKLTRVPLNYAVKFVAEDPILANSTAIVHLIRDPRAMLASRHRLEWCKDECLNPEAICSQIGEDLRDFKKLKKQYPDIPMIQIRHEDLSTDPFGVTKQLFTQLGLKYVPNTDMFLKTHTRMGSLDPYSTRRNSAAVAHDWHQKLSLKETMDIQLTCERVLSECNYDFVQMEKRKINKSIEQSTASTTVAATTSV